VPPLDVLLGEAAIAGMMLADVMLAEVKPEARDADAA
jgi:hypothetical protein